MIMRIKFQIALLGMVVVAACQQAQDGTTSVQGATAVDTVEAKALVTGVDQENRQVGLQTTDGELITIVAGPEVRNFDQIEVGDTVKAIYTQAVAAHLAEVDETAAGADVAIAGVRAEEGDKPAAAIGQEVRTIVEILSYDASSNVVTFVLPDGFVRSVVVRKPEMQAFAETLQPNDKVEIAFAEAIGIGVLPSGQ